MIVGYLNISTIEHKSFGEILDSFYAYFCIALMAGILIFIISLILTKNYNQIVNKENQERWGSLFKYIKVKQLRDRIYYMIFILRRYMYTAVFLLYQKYPGLFLPLFCLQNLMYSLYAGSGVHFKSLKVNRQELFNEMILYACSYMVTMFTLWVPSKIL